MRPRFSVASDTITYFSQARIVLLDNNFLLRRVRQFQMFDEGYYAQRNRMQFNLVMLAALAMLVVELGLIVPGLPANRPIYRDSDKLVRWESEYLNEGKVILQKDHVCVNAPVLEGPNLKSESSWSYCHMTAGAPSSSFRFSADEMILNFSNPDKIKGIFQVTLQGEGFIFLDIHTVYVPLHRDELAFVGLSDNATTLVRNMQRNFDLLRNVTGLTWTLLPEMLGPSIDFRINASQVTPVGHFTNYTKEQHAALWVSGIIQGILTVRASSAGSQLYEMVDNGLNPAYNAVPLKKRKVLVGAYTGTLVPAFFIVAFTSCSILAHIVLCIFLRAPPGGAWELLQAHGRHSRDRILAGPPGGVVNIQESDGKSKRILETN